MLPPLSPLSTPRKSPASFSPSPLSPYLTARFTITSVDGDHQGSAVASMLACMGLPFTFVGTKFTDINEGLYLELQGLCPGAASPYLKVEVGASNATVPPPSGTGCGIQEEEEGEEEQTDSREAESQVRVMRVCEYVTSYKRATRTTATRTDDILVASGERTDGTEKRAKSAVLSEHK